MCFVGGVVLLAKANDGKPSIHPLSVKAAFYRHLHKEATNKHSNSHASKYRYVLFPFVRWVCSRVPPWLSSLSFRVLGSLFGELIHIHQHLCARYIFFLLGKWSSCYCGGLNLVFDHHGCWAPFIWNISAQWHRFCQHSSLVSIISTEQCSSCVAVSECAIVKE